MLELVPQASVQTIPNGVDIDYFKPQGLPTLPDRLIFVGRMNWYPNIKAVQYIAKNIWPKLKQKHPGLECDIIGANPPMSVITLSKELPGFNVHGFVDDVRPFIESATIYVCPIQDGGGTKLKILDAMAMAKAIVAHPVACEGIGVRNNQNIMIAENETAFVDTIDFLLKTKEKRETLGKNARRLVEEHYNYYSIGKNLSHAFQTCL